ncbi:hypothetical protein ASF53_23695 [Methylobacterium sp. Leaf123]|uniref:hypothetical protein n=1 Tax=Methylobacterium sp. Leaf123 TaxID=1736264 RepID=UPI000700B4CB|nr:hypothetical protein [Methylobacterium sp. Leaf123]KQQ20132.1 hypothetical protein ASF53_23695 [Methylobacterium sp. Leaf123]
MRTVMLTALLMMPASHAWAEAPPSSTFRKVTSGVSEVSGPATETLDLISSVPTNGTWVGAAGAPIKCEPVLGPFHERGTDLTRCQSARYFTATGDSNKGEYGTLLNMRSDAGFPTACERNKSYPEFGTCLNDGGKMYRVKERRGSKTYHGTTAPTGSGPTGTGDTIVDGSVTWRYEPNFAPGNGGKTNLALMTYQGANAGATWTGAFAHQIASGGPKKTGFTLELDLNNYWGDYATGPNGPVATALQIFTGGPKRSSSAISVGQYDHPTDSTSLINGIVLCCSTLVRDNTVMDLTGSVNGYFNQGAHTGSAFTDGSTSAISFNSYGGAGIGFRHTGSSGVGLKLEGRYSGFQVQGQGWNVNPTGVVTSSGEVVNGSSSVSGTTTIGKGLTVDAGPFKPAQYAVSDLFPCRADARGSLVVVTDLSAPPAYRQTKFKGGGSLAAPVFCNGTEWEIH